MYVYIHIYTGHRGGNDIDAGVIGQNEASTRHHTAATRARRSRIEHNETLRVGEGRGGGGGERHRLHGAGGSGVGTADDDWESVVVGECEDSMLQTAITRLYTPPSPPSPYSGGAAAAGGRGDGEGGVVKTGYFSRAALGARRRRVCERWSATAHTSLEVKGLSVRCRIFGGFDWSASQQLV